MNAPALPRRVVLRGLGALPATTLVVAPVARASVLASPDAALIAAARRACVLAVLEEKAAARRCDALARLEAVEPEHPGDVQPKVSAAMRAIMDEAPTPLTPAGDRLMQAYHRVAQRAGQLARERHETKVAAHDAERERLCREVGLVRAEEVADYLTERLVNAVERLTAIPSTTPAGTAAKARVWIAVNAGGWGKYAPAWHANLAACVMQEAAALIDGGRP